MNISKKNTARQADLIGSLLEAEAEGKPSRFLFVRDPNRLMEGALWAPFRGQTYRLVFFKHILSLRDALEDLKDAEGAFPLAVVVLSGEPPSLQPAADLTSRAAFVDISPLKALELAAPERAWPAGVDLLHGADFWDALPGLIERRAAWGEEVPASQTPAMIAEAFLGRSLREPMSEEEALELWRQTEEDDRLIGFFTRNRPAAEAVQAAIQRSVSIEQKLARDPDFAAFIWTTHFLRKYGSNPQLLLPQFFNAATWAKYSNHTPEELSNVCSDILQNDPERAVSHVRIAERSLTQLPEREQLFFNLIGLEGGKKTETALRIAAEETVSGYLTEQCLRVLLPRAVDSPGSISKTRLAKLRRVLNQTHLGARYPAYYRSLNDAADLFMSTLRLSELVEQYYAENWENRFNSLEIEQWMEELYPRCLTPMSLLRDELLGRLSRGAAMLSGEPEALLEEAGRILDVCDLAFAYAVERGYVRWISRKAPPPVLTVDFLDVFFLPEWKRLSARSRMPLAVVCLFQGLRWDEWELIAPVVSKALPRHRLEWTRPMLALLPTSWKYNTSALLLGRFPSIGDSGPPGPLLKDRLAAESIHSVETVGSSNLHFPEITRGVVLANIVLKGSGPMKRKGAGDSRAELLQAAEEHLDSFLKKIPPRAVVMVVSNGGTCETTQPAFLANQNLNEIHPRWIGVASMTEREARMSRAAYFNSEAIRFPNPNTPQCAFAHPGFYFSTGAEEQGGFQSGGVSLGEMVVPCALFRSRRSASDD